MALTRARARPSIASQYDYQAKKRKEEMGGAPQHEIVCESGDALANARPLLERAEALAK